MALRELLAAGQFGVSVSLPERLVITRETDTYLTADDRDTGVRWDLFVFPDLACDFGAAYQGELGRALEAYARAMFEDAFVASGATGKPRSADPTWSPMVEVEHLDLGGARALRTVHRMLYQPGLELVMGHLLVPLARGLFEVRVQSLDRTTGMRESVLMVKMGGMPAQHVYDDPALDATFPQHALSRTRAALAWLVRDAGLRVLEPAAPLPTGAIPLPALGCVVEPPPRFALDPAAAGAGTGEAWFRRCSFCGTDGLESLQVAVGARSIRLDELRAHARKAVRKLHADSGVRALDLHVEDLAPIDGRPHMLVVAEGIGHQGRLRNTFRWWLDDDGRPWTLSIAATAAVSVATRLVELEAAARSWRRLA